MSDTFDAPDRLNDDGTVTFTIAPSNWRRYNVSPDTYQSFNGDSWTESELENLREVTGRDVAYDDVEWTYDHAGIVRDLAKELVAWIAETLAEAGVPSVSVKLVDSWSPQFYNFQSDGFEAEVTCDPAELRAVTPDFDVDAWASKHYRSVDGFLSFVTSRMEEDEWRAGYDAEFRVESLLVDVATSDPYRDESDGWFYRLVEAEYEVYMNNVTVELKEVDDDDDDA